MSDLPPYDAEKNRSKEVEAYRRAIARLDDDSERRRIREFIEKVTRPDNGESP